MEFMNTGFVGHLDELASSLLRIEGICDIPSIEKQFLDLVVRKSIQLVTDWMAQNPGRRTPRVIIRWPDGKLLINHVVIMLHPDDCL